MRHHLVIMLREGAGREPSPTAAIVTRKRVPDIDTQSVNTTESGGPRGYDAAKKVNGRKHHIAVDTQGLLLGVLVHVASIQDADGVGELLGRITPLYCWLRTVFANSIYNPVAALLVPSSHRCGAYASRVPRPYAFRPYFRNFGGGRGLAWSPSVTQSKLAASFTSPWPP